MAAGQPSYWFGSLIADQRDASGLLYRRNRVYDPATGRFTQEDPIGIGGGLNTYGFGGGDAINFSDPYGLDCTDRNGKRAPCATTLKQFVTSFSSMHYDRNRNNVPSPATKDRAALPGSGWVAAPRRENAFHQFGAGNERNVKFRTADGHSEVVYGANGLPVSDPTNAGTYNYGTERVEHLVFDVAPYIVLGNGPGDRTTFVQRISTMFAGAVAFLPTIPNISGSYGAAKCAPYCN